MPFLWELKDEIRYRKGVGPRRAAALRRLGIETVGDLIAHFPRSHEDRRQITPLKGLSLAGEVITVQGRIERSSLRRVRGRMTILTVMISDDSGRAELVWFNQDFLQKKMEPGARIIVTGSVKRGGLIPSITVKEYGFLEGEEGEEVSLSGGRITPIYPLTTGLSAGWMRKEIHSILASTPVIDDPLPAELRAKHGLIDLNTAIRTFHYPSSDHELKRARERLAFDEFFRLQLAMSRRRILREKRTRTRRYSLKGELVRRINDRLGYRLTDGQRRAIEEIRSDLAGTAPMNRLLQGDVGSGKTVVAVLTAALAAEDGYQTAFMVPTELVAEQHYRNWRERLLEAGIHSALLTSSVKGKERAAILRAVKKGDCRVLFGTHALIEEEITFARLGLAVIDEQHRFGVLQRKRLIEKGEEPDVLVLTATPIPRTLAMTVYSDLDLSTVRDRPPGRQPVKTTWLAGEERKRMMSLLSKELELGHRIFFVYPLVEESEKVDLKNAKDQAERIRQAFPEYGAGLVTGRQKGEEKERIMRAFQSGEIQILVATTVVEVGVDVPEATVMVIEHAERFGLAQLHQLRGRVGRSDKKSYCVLTTAPVEVLSFPSRRRMETMVATEDGFKIAEEDLLLRGPGEFMGLRQHGVPELRVARLVGDEVILKTASQAAREIILADPGLKEPCHLPVRNWLASARKENSEEVLDA